jgi:hypothetical protein
MLVPYRTVAESLRNIRFVFPVPVLPDGEQNGGKPETDKQNWAKTRCCLSTRSIGRGETRRSSCLPAPSPLSGIQHRSEEQKADIRHLSEREEQGFHTSSSHSFISGFSIRRYT